MRTDAPRPLLQGRAFVGQQQGRRGLWCILCSRTRRNARASHHPRQLGIRRAPLSYVPPGIPRNGTADGTHHFHQPARADRQSVVSHSHPSPPVMPSPSVTPPPPLPSPLPYTTPPHQRRMISHPSPLTSLSPGTSRRQARQKGCQKSQKCPSSSSPPTSSPLLRPLLLPPAPHLTPPSTRRGARQKLGFRGRLRSRQTAFLKTA